ncbi:MAG TPA: PGPGW domain-containing protein [Egibacteraceae bacterium]|nr:PGPGW domain-containing protein [Egibacteraceae bacterium]
MGDETDRIRLKLANRRWDTRRVAVTLVGFVVLLLGFTLLLLPGPGLLVIGLGFAILATEFLWAWRAKRFVEKKARSAGHRTRWLRSGRFLRPPQS